MTKLNRAAVSCYVKMQTWKANAHKKADDFIHEERGGAEIIAAIILLAVVVLLGVVFREKIQELLNTIWGGVDEQAGKLGDPLAMGSAAPSGT